MATGEPVNYSEARENLPSGSDFWKPDRGEYEVLFLGELSESEPYRDEETGEETPQCEIPVQVVSGPDESETGKEYRWSMTRGGELSKYGQIVNLAKSFDDSLSGKSARVTVQGTKPKRYVITRA